LGFLTIKLRHEPALSCCEAALICDIVHELEAAPMGQNTKLIGTGMTGALVSITPVLVVLLGALGLTAWIGKLDYVLIPVLVASIGLVIFAVVRRKRACPAKTTQSP
jgi:mercuric ion transport protein